MVAVIRQDARLSVVTPPTGEVMTVAELKTHLRVDGSTEDTYIASLLTAAIGEIDTPSGWLGRSLLSRTLRLTFDEAPGDLIYLPGPPVSALSSITYRDITNAWVTMASTDYDKDVTASPALVWPLDVWPSDMIGGVDGVRVQYVAGYTNGAAVPQPIRQWLLLRVGEMYRDREASIIGDTAARLHHADRMLDAWRVYA